MEAYFLLLVYSEESLDKLYDIYLDVGSTVFKYRLFDIVKGIHKLFWLNGWYDTGRYESLLKANLGDSTPMTDVPMMY